jgi:2-polyprenyl-6-methoxyphenol hydroxylase-like FAD-dependent oxidoreductase
VQIPQECDALVAGGGPAGSTIAALLAQRAKHVVVLEKDRFSRFHIGESLLPLNLPLFDGLGVAEDVRRIGVYKPGAEVVSDQHGQATTFRFTNNHRLPVNHSYHVRRADFDQLLLENCRQPQTTPMTRAEPRETGTSWLAMPLPSSIRYFRAAS